MTTPNPTNAGGATPNPALGTGTPGAGDTNAGQGTTPPGGTPPQPPAGEDFKAKFGESTRENQRLMDLFKANGLDPKTGKPVTTTTPPANNQPANGDGTQQFTDAELEKAIPGFAYLSEEEKETIRHAKNIAKTLTSMQRTVAELYDEREFNKQLTIAKKKPEYKLLADNEDEFKEYAYKEENLNVPFDHVARSFIFTKVGTGNGGTATPTPPREGMEGGTAGASTFGKQVGDKLEMTAEEAAALRQKDQRRYTELVRTKKLVIVGDK